MKKWTTLALVGLLALAAMAAAAPDERRLKMRVAVAPIDWSNSSVIEGWQIPVEFRNAINDKLVKKLLETGRFVVLEREEMEALLTEKGIKEENTGESQRDKTVPAQALVRGRVTDFSLAKRGGGGGIDLGPVRVGGSASEARVTINIRIFDVDTSEVIASEDASGSAQAGGFSIGASIGSAFTTFEGFERTPLGKATTSAIDQAVEKIVARLGKQPWQALVADYDAPTREVTINAGSEVGVRVGDAFDVYRVTRVVRDPETGAVLSRRMSKVGSIRITEVERKVAIGLLVDGEGFQPGDVVREPSR